VARPDAQGTPGGLVQIDNDDIGGVVTSRNGAEAGVWVIAETTELGTRFAKIAVTDDHGRFVIPDLPPATYDVWVRGYGLVDSPKVKSPRGRLLNLNAVVAQSSSVDAWTRRLQSGPGGGTMVRTIGTLNTNDGGHLRRLAEWTDRIRAGELPVSTPARPHGMERNLVVTVYDWLSPKYYVHDLIVTDRRQPTVNAFGPIYGAAELSTDNPPVLDPVKITKTTMRVPIRDQDAPSSALANKVAAPSPYFGLEQVWDSKVNAHNPMMDADGRVYYTAQSRSPKKPPAYCAAA